MLPLKLGQKIFWLFSRAVHARLSLSALLKLKKRIKTFPPEIKTWACTCHVWLQFLSIEHWETMQGSFCWEKIICNQHNFSFFGGKAVWRLKTPRKSVFSCDGHLKNWTKGWKHRCDIRYWNLEEVFLKPIVFHPFFPKEALKPSRSIFDTEYVGESIPPYFFCAEIGWRSCICFRKRDFQIEKRWIFKFCHKVWATTRNWYVVEKRILPPTPTPVQMDELACCPARRTFPMLPEIVTVYQL